MPKSKPINLEDAAYKMSMPSYDPADVLGYTQMYQRAMQNPISAAGWNPQYDVYIPPEKDIYNKGPGMRSDGTPMTRVHGMTVPAGESWSMYDDTKPGRMMTSHFDELAKSKSGDDQEDAMRWAESDQTAYLGAQVRNLKKETPIHESVHRGIGKLYQATYGNRLSSKENKVMTRIWDYRNSERAETEKGKKHIAKFIEGYSGMSLDKALAKYEPILEEMSTKAESMRSKYKDDEAGDMDIVWFKQGKNNAIK